LPAPEISFHYHFSIGDKVEYFVNVPNYKEIDKLNYDIKDINRVQTTFGQYVGTIKGLEANDSIEINHLNGTFLYPIHKLIPSLIQKTIKDISNVPGIFNLQPIYPAGFIKDPNINTYPTSGILSDIFTPNPDGTGTFINPLPGDPITEFYTYNYYTPESDINLTMNYYRDFNNFMYIMDPITDYRVLLVMKINENFYFIRIDDSKKIIGAPQVT
jgi:hypothetical protein